MYTNLREWLHSTNHEECVPLADHLGLQLIILAVLQRVKSASVTVNGELISTIGKGLLIFAGVAKEDNVKEVESMANKILKVKLWDADDGKKWKKNVQDIDGEILCGMQHARCGAWVL